MSSSRDDYRTVGVGAVPIPEPPVSVLTASPVTPNPFTTVDPVAATDGSTFSSPPFASAIHSSSQVKSVSSATGRPPPSPSMVPQRSEGVRSLGIAFAPDAASHSTVQPSSVSSTTTTTPPAFAFSAATSSDINPAVPLSANPFASAFSAAPSKRTSASGPTTNSRRGVASRQRKHV